MQILGAFIITLKCNFPFPIQENLFITQDGSLLLTGLITNVSYHCVAHWRDSVTSHNGSHYQLVIDQIGSFACDTVQLFHVIIFYLHCNLDTYHVSVYPESVKARVGESIQFVCAVSGLGQNYSIKWYNSYNPEITITHSHVLDIHHVQLNDSGSYYCEVKDELGTVVSNLSSLQVIGT